MPDAVIVHVYEDAKNQLEAFIVSSHFQNSTEAQTKLLQVVAHGLGQAMRERDQLVTTLLALVLHKLGHDRALAHLDQLLVGQSRVHRRVQGFELARQRRFSYAGRLREYPGGIVAGLGRNLACDADQRGPLALRARDE